MTKNEETEVLILLKVNHLKFCKKRRSQFNTSTLKVNRSRSVFSQDKILPQIYIKIFISSRRKLIKTITETHFPTKFPSILGLYDKFKLFQLEGQIQNMIIMNSISNIIIRPKKSNYSVKDLGPSEFSIGRKFFYRKDLSLKSIQGEIQCSWYLQGSSLMNPCIVYCHGNCGSRLDVSDLLEEALLSSFSVFTFDFGGCGLSDGKFITLGIWERYDIEAVVEYLKQTGRVSKIALWGRSMGAVAVMMYASTSSSLPVIVLDSPFSSFTELFDDIFYKYKVVPERVKNAIFEKMRKNIKNRTKIDLRKINPLRYIHGSCVPTLIIHSIEDELIPIEHSKRIYAVLEGPKVLIKNFGQHNEPRPLEMLRKMIVCVEYFVGNSSEIEDENATSRAPAPDIPHEIQDLLNI